MIVGGIIPPADAERLKAAGVAAVYTPKDFAINGILGAIVQEVEARFDAEQALRAARAIPQAPDTTKARVGCKKIRMNPKKIAWISFNPLADTGLSKGYERKN